ncbi:hypothetical protein [Amycolatopsis sp. cmx-4-61]|uniref:hypothetical protein n=1 Tax=Amycolatopsis sp. cmx-4-61 TaxID=2790937 RepID=UPI00397B7D61
MTSPIEREYRALLESRGLGHLLEPPDPASVREFAEGLSEAEREFLAIDVEELRRDGYRIPARHRFGEEDARIRKTLAASGFDLPGPVYVGEYPHHEFNAHATAAGSGTLILVNTGLVTLLDRAGIAIGASTRPFTRREGGEISIADVTTEEQQRHESAVTMLAKSVVTYLSANEVPLPARPRMPFGNQEFLGYLIVSAAKYFVVAHEFGHLLAGHVHEAAEPRVIAGWSAGSLHREYEADELAMLLLLRGLDESAPFHEKALTVAGPFVFLALDHLVDRVQQELYELPEGMTTRTHPPSDKRGAALRAVVTELADPNLLQFADGYVSWLSAQEDKIVATARRLLDHP